ncbi:polyprenyl synthetase family protein [Desulfotalea psychrophila]|uniref:Probable geranylgeranyl pyrophosphate synthase n=1 Tax=Desulfotalea psychrophila (strain LSv54 / DSM 12343) TaxID=177439 RepID=Q6AJQ2_DESPS|nr:farnesyl diphosphate synthase [Desulfotalea psychrophila]CAG37428.1 probable geranylgeranyl pyrophosphate synthase [Desulfotalea psychrophila LSv54]
MNIKNYLEQKRSLVEEAMDRFMLEESGPFKKHIEAMRYSLFAGGKRIRPILCLAAADSICAQERTQENLLPVACALECIHTYSLIHDDLPAMDDDQLRRGKATNHVLYGEAGAILAGDGLLSWAFDLIADRGKGNLTAEKRLDICHMVARAAGSLGMVGGQQLDIQSENKEIDFDTLATIHRSKTGALITCSIMSGAIGAGANAKQLHALEEYGNNIGLAFQIIDDLLDATATTEELGKTAGSDAEHGKATYPLFFGIDKTREKAKAAVDNAIKALTLFDHRADPLRGLANYIYSRTN